MKTKLIAALIAASTFGAAKANAEVKVSTKGIKSKSVGVSNMIIIVQN